MLPTLLFILHLPPPVHGASMVGKYIQDSQYIKSRFDCHYINLTTAKDLSDIGKLNWKKLKQFIILLLNIRKTVKLLKPSLVYVTPNSKGGAFYKDFIVVQMLKLMGCRVVLHYHNKGVSKRQERFLDNLLYYYFFKNTKVILLANSLYEDIEKYVSINDIYICPNGIPESIINASNISTPPNTFKLLFLSNLLKSKGVCVLLEACQILRKQEYKFVCEFVGGETEDFDSISFQKELKKRKLEDCVYYLGKKYGSEKELILQNAKLFILPTFDDCFPLVLLEAMQHKIVCISTNEGGISDIIEHGQTGFIVEKNNPEDLAEKIVILIKNDELRIKMGEAGYKLFKSKYTLSAFEKHFVDVLVQNLVS